MPHDLLYFDYQASTPIDEAVLDLMVAIYRNEYGNPHSAEHRFGWDAHAIGEAAREQVARLIGARRSRDVIFTSGATEANNLAIKGLARARAEAGDKRRRILMNPLEHKCALMAGRVLEKEGFTVQLLPMDASGVVKVGDLENMLGDDVLMVVLQAVNNEIGTIQPLAEAAALCEAAGVLLHCDAAQAVGRVPLDMGGNGGIASMSLSGHKAYGPKGVGALYLREREQVVPLFDGGGQERGIRSGTLPIPLLAGFGKACEIAAERLAGENAHAVTLRQEFLQGLQAAGVAFSMNGSDKLGGGDGGGEVGGGEVGERIPANININLPQVASVDFFQRIKGIAVSAGSACSSGDGSFSHVLQAIGVAAGDSSAHIRLTIGRPTTSTDIATAVTAIADAVKV